MTTTDHPPEVAEADAALADLERRFVEGDDVPVEHLEDAERQSRLARLTAKRRQRQAEKDADEERRRRVAAVKAELVAELEAFDAEIPGLYAKARDAVEELADRLVAHEDAVRDVKRRLSGLGATEVAGRKTVGGVTWGFTDLRVDERVWQPQGVVGYIAAAALHSLKKHRRHLGIGDIGRPLTEMASYFREPTAKGRG